MISTAEPICNDSSLSFLEFGQLISLPLSKCRPTIVSMHLEDSGILNGILNSTTDTLINISSKDSNFRPFARQKIFTANIYGDLSKFWPMVASHENTVDFCIVMVPSKNAFMQQFGQSTMDPVLAILSYAMRSLTYDGVGVLIGDDALLSAFLTDFNSNSLPVVSKVWAHLSFPSNLAPYSGVLYFSRRYDEEIRLNHRLDLLNDNKANSENLLNTFAGFKYNHSRIHDICGVRDSIFVDQNSKTFWQSAGAYWNALYNTYEKQTIVNPDLLCNKPRDNEQFYTLTLSPGDVRYLSAKVVTLDNINAWIQYIETLSINPTFCPFGRNGVFDTSFEELIRTDSWKLRFQIYCELFTLHTLKLLTWEAYAAFHTFLNLQTIELKECAEACVYSAIGNVDIMNSYLKSPNHISVDYGYHGPRYVFFKTPFVLKHLEFIEVKKKEDEFKAQQEQEAADLEKIAKSNYDTFVYIMEDLRNNSYKIGRSKTPNKRERTLQSEVPQIVMRLSVPASESHEIELHNHFASKRIRGEWFSLDKKDIIWIVSYLKQNGDSTRATANYEWLGKVLLESQ